MHVCAAAITNAAGQPHASVAGVIRSVRPAAVVIKKAETKRAVPHGRAHTIRPATAKDPSTRRPCHPTAYQAKLPGETPGRTRLSGAGARPPSVSKRLSVAYGR